MPLSRYHASVKTQSCRVDERKEKKQLRQKSDQREGVVRRKKEEDEEEDEEETEKQAANEESKEERKNIASVSLGKKRDGHSKRKTTRRVAGARPPRRRVVRVPGLTAEAPFPFESLRVVGLDQPLAAQAFLGPQCLGRLAAENLVTARDVIDFIREHTRRENWNLFKRVFSNPTWANAPSIQARCVGRYGNAAHSGRPPHRYAVREHNFYGWNSLHTLVSHYLPTNDEDRFYSPSRSGVSTDRVPPPLVPRSVTQAFPNYC